MRERSIKVKTTKLQALNEVFPRGEVARKLGISRQRWHRWKVGQADIPESMLDRICETFKLDKNDLALS